MKHSLSLVALFAALPAFADGTRQLDAHEHGVGALNIAVDGRTVAMEFEAPGADIVGFEHPAINADDRAAIDAAVSALAAPLDLFVLPTAAGCSVTRASAALTGDHEEHHEEHADHDDHEDHDNHDDHAHEEHHDEHHEDDHAEHAGHDHAEEGDHTEFHAEYMLDCAHPKELTQITFAYFERFENAREVDVQVVTGSGAQAFEVDRAAPVLDLRSLF